MTNIFRNMLIIRRSNWHIIIIIMTNKIMNRLIRLSYYYIIIITNM